jgi:hypothetical protein
MTKAPNDTTFHRCVVYRRLPYCSEKEKKHPNGVLSGASLHDAFDYYLAVDQENSTNFSAYVLKRASSTSFISSPQETCSGPCFTA